MNTIRLKQYPKWKKRQFYMLIIVILISFVIAIQAPLLSENLSFIGNALHHRGLLVLWGTCTACYFWFAFLTLSHLSALIPKRIALYCALACLLMVIATILPYDEGRVPMLSFLHTAAAMLGTGIYIACYWYCLFVYQSIDYWFYRIAMSCYNLLLLFCLLLIATFASINTLAEILFSIVLPLLQYRFLCMQEQKGIPLTK